MSSTRFVALLVAPAERALTLVLILAFLAWIMSRFVRRSASKIVKTAPLPRRRFTKPLSRTEFMTEAIPLAIITTVLLVILAFLFAFARHGWGLEILIIMLILYVTWVVPAIIHHIVDLVRTRVDNNKAIGFQETAPERSPVYMGFATRSAKWTTARVTIALGTMVAVTWPFFVHYRFGKINRATPISADQVVTFTGSILTVLIALLLMYGFSQRYIDCAAAWAINSVLLPSKKAVSLPTRRNVVSDPLFLDRGSMIRAARLLDITASKIERRGGRVRPHPVSTLYRASSAKIRDFVTSPESLVATIPDTMYVLLVQTMELLTGSLSEASYKQLATAWSAFAPDGTPTNPPPPVRFPRLAAVLLAIKQGAEPADKLVSFGLRIIILIVAVVLILLGKSGVLDFVKQRP